MKELICIVCPKGCHLSVDIEKDYKVSGNACPRGSEYAKNELQAPTRVVTSTVCIKNAIHKRCPVKTTTVIPKPLVNDAMQLLNDICLTAPVKKGDIVFENICGTNVNFVATRSM